MLDVGSERAQTNINDQHLGSEVLPFSVACLNSFAFTVGQGMQICKKKNTITLCLGSVVLLSDPRSRSYNIGPAASSLLGQEGLGLPVPEEPGAGRVS